MITLQELTMGRDKKYPEEYSKDIQKNLQVLLEKLNIIRKLYGRPMVVASGWRPKAINDKTANAAKASKHLSGLACDIRDTDKSLWLFCINNLELMQELGLYLEDKRYTSTWVHFQIGPPASGKRIFKPNSSPPTNSSLWDGQYDTKYDKIE